MRFLGSFSTFVWDWLLIRCEDRFVINDTFRSSLCLVHPPHLIALACIYLALSLQPPLPPSARKPSTTVGGRTDPITFLSSLAVDQSLVLEVVQEVLGLYELWHALEARGEEKVVEVLERMRRERGAEVAEMESERGKARDGAGWKK